MAIKEKLALFSRNSYIYEVSNGKILNAHFIMLNKKKRKLNKIS